VEQGLAVAIILGTGHGDIPMTVQAAKAGAIDFLSRPFRDQDTLDAVSAAHDRGPTPFAISQHAGRS